MYSKFFITHKLDFYAASLGVLVVGLIGSVFIGTPLCVAVCDAGLLGFMFGSYGFLEAQNPFKVPE